MTIWMFEKDGHLEVGKRWSSGCWKKMVIWMLEKNGHLDGEKDGHLDGEINDNQV